MPRVEVHILSYNEREILPWTVEAYSHLATRIIIHDAFSTDGTRDVIRKWFPHVEIRDWDTGNEIRDDLAAELKSNAGRDSDCQWVVTVDADEILWIPTPLQIDPMQKFEPVIRPTGYEMIADNMHEYQGSGSFNGFIKRGVRNDRYSKPILFQPGAFSEFKLSPGAHFIERAILKDGTEVKTPEPDPSIWLCHCKYIGPVERTMVEFTRDRSRLSTQNRENGWGSFLLDTDPAELARQRRADLDKRATRIL